MTSGWMTATGLLPGAPEIGSRASSAAETWETLSSEPSTLARLWKIQTGISMSLSSSWYHSPRGSTPMMLARVPCGRVVMTS